jgi:membrane protein DedA with SNARE-associated domain
VLLACIGGVAGDQFFYLLGRFKGKSMIRLWPALDRKSPRVLALVDRYRVPAIIGLRFLYGLRMAAPFAIGMSGVPVRLFVLLNAISGLLWAVVFGTAGYFLGAGLSAVVSSPAARLVVGALMTVIGVAAAMRYMAVRRRAGSRPMTFPLRHQRGRAKAAQGACEDVEQKMDRRGVNETVSDAEHKVGEDEACDDGRGGEIAAHQ